MREPVDAANGAPWTVFRRDLTASLAAWRRAPGLPLWTLALAALIEVPSAAARSAGHGGWAVLALPFELVMAGWVGTQRIWYLRVFDGKTLSSRQLLRITNLFIGPFVGLDILVGVPVGIVVVVVALVRPPGWILYLGLVTLIVDVVLTFVTPALAYSTRSPMEAMRIGWRELRADWPRCRWYALTPAVAILVVNRALPRSTFGLLPAAGIGVLAWMLNLWFKGATAAYYLRAHPVPSSGPALP